MTAPTYTQQQTPHLFGQTPGYDPFNPYGTSFQGGLGQQWGQHFGQQHFGQQQWGQQGSDIYTLVWQLLGYAQQSIQLAQQVVLNTLQQLPPYQMTPQYQWQQTPFQPRGFQRQPMAW